jgi:anti-anti-sigma regulatory factor
MTKECFTIELAEPDEAFRATDAEGARASTKTSLHAERVGLLARTVTSSRADDRRMEDWIASHLDLEELSAAKPRGPWAQIIDSLPGLKKKPKEPARNQSSMTTSDSWKSFQVAYKRGITVVRLVDKAIVKESQIRELARDLLDLIAAGNDRIVLSFQAVERVASWMAFVVDEAWRRCASTDGGALKVSGLSPRLARMFPIAGVGLRVSLHENEFAAIESAWPQVSLPRPLPVEILQALTRAADILPIRGGAPSEIDSGDTASLLDDLGFDAALLKEPAAHCEVWLQVQVGAAKGRTIAVHGPRFLIGRDRSCDLRLGSAMVSKLHTAIELRDGRIFLRDLGSTNGTVVAGRTLREVETEVRDGDRIQIGPVVCTLVAGRDKGQTGPVEKMIAGWLEGEGSVSHPYHGESQQTISFPTTQDPPGDAPPLEERIKHEIIQDVLVITPQLPELDDPDAIEELRALFHFLYEQPMPRQVVMNLEFVRHLNAQAIGVLLAHHLRLDRAGGALRLAQTPARVMAVLHQVRLTILVECHPTLDEAVLASWPGTANETSRR